MAFTPIIISNEVVVSHQTVFQRDASAIHIYATALTAIDISILNGKSLPERRSRNIRAINDLSLIITIQYRLISGIEVGDIAFTLTHSRIAIGFETAIDVHAIDHIDGSRLFIRTCRNPDILNLICFSLTKGVLQSLERRSPRQSVITILAIGPYKIRGAVLGLCCVLDGTDVRFAAVVAVVEDEVGLGRDILIGCYGGSVDHRVHIHRGVVDGTAIECRVVGIALYEDGAHGVDKSRIGMVVIAIVAEDGLESIRARSVNAFLIV